MTVTGLVLAAGSSQRLGLPKQLLSYRGKTLLDATLSMARACEFDQLIVALGGATHRIRKQVDLRKTSVVENDQYASGCSSSIRAALEVVDESATGVILLLGDQPGVDVGTVRLVIEEGSDSEIAVCSYNDGIGHPFWFHRTMFEKLSTMHGDKAVWKLIESGQHQLTRIAMNSDTPLDVDTWEDYEALLDQDRNSSSLYDPYQ